VVDCGKSSRYRQSSYVLPSLMLVNQFILSRADLSQDNLIKTNLSKQDGGTISESREINRSLNYNGEKQQTFSFPYPCRR
jgi:hypothetical protein